MKTVELDDLLASFLETRAEAESFSAAEFTAFAAANLPG